MSYGRETRYTTPPAIRNCSEETGMGPRYQFEFPSYIHNRVSLLSVVTPRRYEHDRRDLNPHLTVLETVALPLSYCHIGSPYMATIPHLPMNNDRPQGIIDRDRSRTPSICRSIYDFDFIPHTRLLILTSRACHRDTLPQGTTFVCLAR